MKIALIYLDVPFWRAEVARIALHYGNINFTDLRITREEFLRVKETGTLDDGTNIPFRQIPCLNVDGLSICQTGAISRFCGKLSNLYPRDDAIKAACIDQIIDMATDITELLRASNAEEDEGLKKIMRSNLVDGLLTRKIGFLENLLPNHSSNWFVGETLTIGDIAVWRLMGWLSSGIIDYIPEDILAAFPKLKIVCKNVEKDAKIMDWVDTTYPKGFVAGNFD